MTIEAKLDKTNELLGSILAALAGAGVNAPPSTPAPAPVPLTPGKSAAAEQVPAATKPPKAPKAVKADPPPPPVQTAAADEDIDFDAPPPEAEKPKLTVDTARQALVKLQKAKGSAEASRGVLTANGLKSLAELNDTQQEKIAAIVKGCEAQMPKA